MFSWIIFGLLNISMIATWKAPPGEYLLTRQPPRDYFF